MDDGQAAYNSNMDPQSDANSLADATLDELPNHDLASFNQNKRPLTGTQQQDTQWAILAIFDAL